MLVDKWILEAVDVLLAFFTVYLFSYISVYIFKGRRKL